MKKSMISLALVLSAASLTAADTVTTDSVTTQKVNDGSGFYLGAGVGASFYSLTLTKSDYYVKDGQDPTYEVSGDDLSELDDNDFGYLAYAGYQFNKIIGVEGSYTDYGSFSGTIKKPLKTREYTKKPRVFSVAANAGYNFLNGQLRPFGLLGLGYMNTNQSKSYDALNMEDQFMTLHAGIGVEYYPTVLRGFGIRASWTSDTYVDSETVAYENTTNDQITTVSLWQYYSLLYVGAQYKF